MTRRLGVVVLLAIAACGVKQSPLPPEVVQPEPPSEIVAKSTPEGVRLSWKRPTTYSGGQHMRDLAGFDIERADGADGGFVRVGAVEVTDRDRFRQEKTTEWVDATAVAGETYRYRVVATTLDGYRSSPGGPVTVDYRAAAPRPETSQPTPANKPR